MSNEKNEIKKIRLYFLLAAICIAIPVLSQLYVGQTGKIIVASEQINGNLDFEKTVIYIFNHSLWGAKGVILNKPISDDKKQDFFHDDNLYPAFIGGPVFFPDLRIVAIEHSKAINKWRNQHLFIFDYKAIDEVLSKRKQNAGKDIRVYIGVSGWGFGQLEQEIKMGAWDVQDFQYSYLNEPNLWEKLKGREHASD
ncbi:MAG: YqgE/AlgH family protein [Alphaproteobacteria bacterium]